MQRHQSEVGQLRRKGPKDRQTEAERRNEGNNEVAKAFRRDIKETRLRR